MNHLGQKIVSWLEQEKVEFKLIAHAPAKTCEGSALHRGTPQRWGGKSLLLKAKQGFYILTMRADQKADSNAIRQILKSQKLRFATETELFHLCEVEKGALPAFGEPIYPFPLIIEKNLLENEWITFNIGSTKQSIILPTQSYLTIANPSAVHSFAYVD